MKLVHVHQASNHMATTFSLKISCTEKLADRARRTLAEAHREVARLEDCLSEFRESSPVHRINLAPPFERVRVAPDVIELLHRCERLKRLTRGAFDCCAKSSKKSEAPIGCDKKTLDAWRTHDGAHLGFGAIGKGYALDRVRTLIEQQGFGDYLLSAGGSSIVISGQAGPGDPWRWGWSWKKDEQGEALGIPFTHDSGAGIAIGVSGTQEKGSHLIDAVSARPALATAQSALIAAPSAADADALSTALFVAGFEASQDFLSNLPYSPATAQIDDQGIAAWNGIFKQYWGDITRAKFALATAATFAFIAQSARADDIAVDLSGMSASVFNPYVTERSFAWALLPFFILALLLVHLKKNRRLPMKPTTPTQAKSLFFATLSSALLWSTLEQAHAVDLVPMGKALIGVLGTPKAFQKKIGDSTLFYSKNAQGKADQVAFIEKNNWQNSCTHTWIVGVGPNGKVTTVVAQEQQCPHAKPSAAASFLDQYRDKGPADLAKLKSEVNTVAKATGSCDLATDAVIRAVTSYQKIKSQI